MATAQEQLMLELINRARMNPAAEAARQGIALNQGLAPNTISTAPKQVLAMNDKLVLAADNHSRWMHLNDQFSHTEPSNFANGRTGLDPDDRMTAAGYAPAGTFFNGENISFTGQTAAINATTAIISQHRDLFLSPGHRENIMDAGFREIGVGQELGMFFTDGNNFNASMVTQNFATVGAKVFVTGVVYNDTVVNDDFFTVGEQTVGRTVSGTGVPNDITGGGGGYELGFSTTGAKTITFDLASPDISVGVTVATTNIKLDLVNGKEIWTNSNLTVISGPVTELHALGIVAVEIVGTANVEKFFGNAAFNRLTGGGGGDYLDGGAAADRMVGQTGADIYVVDNGGDVVDESGGDASADLVQSTVTFSLASLAQVIGNVENLTLIGTAAINGTGNALANVLTGNQAINGLIGGGGSDALLGNGGNDAMKGEAGFDRLAGGLGNDYLVGGADADAFMFTSVANTSTNRDSIADFTHGLDQIWMDNAFFPQLGAAGPLNGNFFRLGAAALDADDFIVYDQSNGAVYFDPNGNGAGGAIMFAVLATKPVLTASDIVVI